MTTALELLSKPQKRRPLPLNSKRSSGEALPTGTPISENPRITRAMIDKEAEAIARERDRRRE